MPIDAEYLDELKKRGKESKVYVKYQLTGLQIADMLDDRSHKALFIRLAKQHDETKLVSLAKSISQNDAIKNKGAYFMKVFFAQDKIEKQKGKLKTHTPTWKKLSP